MITIGEETVMTAEDVMFLLKALPKPDANTPPTVLFTKPDGSKAQFNLIAIAPEADLKFTTPDGGEVAAAKRFAWVYHGAIVFPVP